MNRRGSFPHQDRHWLSEICVRTAARYAGNAQASRADGTGAAPVPAPRLAQLPARVCAIGKDADARVRRRSK